MNSEIFDEFGKSVCDQIIKLQESPEKVQEAEKVKENIILKLKDWEWFLEHFPKDSNRLLEIALALDRSEPDFSESLFNKVVLALPIAVLQKNPKLFLEYIQLQKGDITKNFSFIASVPELVESVVVQEYVLESVCTEYFRSRVIPSMWEHISPSSELHSLIKFLADGDLTGALDFSDSVAMNEKKAFPGCLLFIPLLGEVEQWEKCQETVKSARTHCNFPELDGWEVRAAYEMDGLKAIPDLNPPAPTFWKEALLVAFKQGKAEAVVEQLEGRNRLSARILLAMLESKPAPEAEELAKMDDLTWAELTMIAEVKKDNTAILVKAAKLNPRSSRIFFLLGKSLSAKNPTKAKALVERSVKIRPLNEEYVKFYDELVSASGGKEEDRLAHLIRLEKKFHGFDKPKWMFDRLSGIYLNLNNLDKAIAELQQLVRVEDSSRAWSRLAEAYKRRGSLRAAVNSYEHLSNLEGGQLFMLPMIRVLIQLREFDEALLKVQEFRQLDLKLDVVNSDVVVDVLEANIHLALLDTTFLSERKAHLKCAVELLATCVAKQANLSIVYKLTGDALLKICDYSKEFWDFSLPKEWNIVDRQSCANKACVFYAAVLELNRKSVLAWYDMAVALITANKIGKDPEMLKRARAFIKQGMKLTDIPSLLSSFWALLAEVVRLSGDPVTHEHHCLIRAITLNKTNDSAWLMLAVLYFEHGATAASCKAFDSAVTYNPLNAIAWCGWSIHAHSSNEFSEARHMFKQSLTLLPTPSALVGYVTHLVDEISKKVERFESAKEVFNFDSILDLIERYNTDETAIYHLGVLCELFGYYEEAATCLSRGKTPESELERVELKAKIFSPDRTMSQTPSQKNARLRTLVEESKQKLRDQLVQFLPIYRYAFETIQKPEFALFFPPNSKHLSIPLLVSSIIAFQLNPPEVAYAALHDALPRHELIDVFPTQMPEGIDNGLRHLEQDGEEPFRYRNRVAKELFEELKRLREEHEASKPTVPVKEFESMQ